MRINLLIHYFIILLFLTPVFSVQAQGNGATDLNTQKFLEERAAIIEPGVLPSSFWYWADVFGEQIRFLVTVGKENKADYLIDIAAERLAEMKSLSEQGIGKYADQLLTKHEDDVKIAEKLYQEVKAKGLQKAQELQADTERQIIIQEADFKQAASQAPEQYKEKRDSVINRIGAGFKKVLSHLKWKKGEIQEQKSSVW